MTLDLTNKRVLVFIVAYNAEKTIGGVLRRIPTELRGGSVEVLVIDDSSKDGTFAAGLAHEKTIDGLKITLLRTPVNQGYGGNQKLGYRYAIENGFDFVALVHGDGQYAPEKLPDLLQPLVRGEAGAVFGSRMMQRGDALRGGMPLYKYVGNKILTGFQNRLLRTRLSEFHSGYRLYSTEALRKIPFERNSNDFHFDTEIIIQLVMAGIPIVELPIPTYYGDEICYVNGLKYAWDVFRTMLRAKFHQRDLLYDRKFDIGPVEENYDVKLGFLSSHTMAIDSVRPGANVIDIGCGRGYVARELAKKAHHVTGVDQYVPAQSDDPKISYYQWNLDRDEFPVDLSEFDQVFLLDIIEHLREPDVFMERLRHAAVQRRPEIILTTANIGFFVTRMMLLAGHFNYGRKGILDRTHTRLFTFRSLRELFEQAGYEVLEMKGIPAPYPKAVGGRKIGHILLAINRALISLSRGLFSYQIYVRAAAKPSVEHLLTETIDFSRKQRKSIEESGMQRVMARVGQFPA
jgi:glycosyltransferase involved in cell wall biosynthesis